MRIISGEYKGKRLSAPKNLPVRPTTDMAKEGLFNILNNSYYFDEIKVLDLFSGTGNLTYEFASRGVEQVVSVEKNSNCVNFIYKTIKDLGWEEKVFVQKSDVFRYLNHTFQKDFDVIFADPPYEMSVEEYSKIIDLVFDKEIIHKDGTLILEHQTQKDFSEHSLFEQQRRYGSVCFSFFSR